MNLKFLYEIIDIVKQDVVKGIVLMGILLIVAFIISLLAILTYKKNKLLQRIINYIPFINKEFVLIGNFSKKEGKIKEVTNKYLELGCKVFKLQTYKQFAEDGTITKENLEKVINKQQETIKHAKKLMKNKNSFIYIGFPHVPLGFLDGYNFTDIDEPILYEYQGMNSECLGKGFFELKRTYNSTLDLVDDIVDKSTLEDEVALKIEQSFRVNDSDIRKIVNGTSIISFGPQTPDRWKITNYAQIDKYQREFDRVLNELKNKGVKKIHLFATTPVSLSFSLGRVIKHYHPEVIIYNYNNSEFDWGINLRTKGVIFI